MYDKTYEFHFAKISHDAEMYRKELLIMRMPKTWETRSGEKIKIKDMSDSHLQNTINMIKRNGWISTDTLNFYLSCSPPSGDMAEYAFDQEQERIFNKPNSITLSALERELSRRNQ